MKRNVQDTVIDEVQQFVRNYFAANMPKDDIERLNEELEVKIMAAFYEHGITSTPNAFKIY